MGGDFNVILSEEGKSGGLPMYPKNIRIFYFALIFVNYLIFLSLLVLLHGELGELMNLVFLKN